MSKIMTIAFSIKVIKQCLFAFLCAATLQATAGNPEVRLAEGPLVSGQGNVHPNMLLSLSVEFPTVGIAYRGDDGAYIRTYEYVGYFNPLKCYEYNGGNRNLSVKDNLTEDGYFRIKSNADSTTHECDDGTFSGNFMNWVSASAIDMLRYALTGGDRVYDTADTTILQRAVLPDTTIANFYANSTYFPRRKVTASDNTSAPDKVTPFKTNTLYIVSCRNRILFSDTSSGIFGNKDKEKAHTYCSSVFDPSNPDKAETKDKKLGEYLVRVKVCDSEERTARTSLCQKYGEHYKPVGTIQRNADKLRMAAMGYLLDDSTERYGGVLRAPMKYVGSKKYEAAKKFIEEANDRPEWDATTGVFIDNPDQNPEVTRSGVINYLNQFGRSGGYKRYDPLSELYYEGIRYLQGKQPTEDAVHGMDDAMKDGFPVIKDWADPVVASCQKNYIVSIADVNTHWDRYIPGNERTTFGTDPADAHDKVRSIEKADAQTPALDVKEWTKKVGDKESSRNADLADLHTKDTGSAKHATYYMAGLAHWAYTNDIRLDKKTRVKTFAIDVDEGGNGLIDGNNRTLKPRDSQLYLAAKHGGGTSADTGTTNSGCSISNDTPSNYFLASQPKEMIRSIRTVFDSIGGVSGTIAGVSVSTTKISSDGASVFQPGFDSSNWCGSLKKLELTVDKDDKVRIADAAKWDAGQILTGKGETAPNPKPSERNIYTTSIEGGKFVSPIEFKWKDDPVGKEGLTKAQQALFNVSPIDGATDGHGKDRVEYLRGERSLELGRTGGIFRARGSVLGDIVNSNPLYVGPPSSAVQGDGYPKFREDNKTRPRMVYVGANDGMLHAFTAEEGKELFAYVPGVLLPSLSQLTRPDYAHRAYVDGMLTVAEAKLTKGWKTVLASGMGGGAQGVFALDVTDPSNFGSGSGAIFEFTDAHDKDMGNVVSPPVIAKFRVQLDEDTPPQTKYFVVVASGVNSYKEDGAKRASEKTGGALFLLSLDVAPGEKWEENTNYYKFTTSNTDLAAPAGLSAPALVVGADGVVRYAYAGDLQGNLWRFDFTVTTSWKVKPPKAALLFAAADKADAPQPITTQPKVVFAPGGGYVVLFGTGKFLEKDDTVPGYFKPQSFYAIHDTTNSEYKVSGRKELVERTLKSVDNGASLQISGDAFSYENSRGWFFDFLNSGNTGERSATNGLVANGQLFFNTLIPGFCGPGAGRTYILNTLTGLAANGIRTGFLSTVGMLSSPVVFDIKAEVSDRNSVGRRTVKKRSSVFNFGTDGAASAGSSDSIVPAGRFSWREIVNWLDR
jgi:type IV pilus assembly protein PilY1